MSNSDLAGAEGIDLIHWIMRNFPDRVKRIERRVRLGDREKVDILTLGEAGGDDGGGP